MVNSNARELADFRYRLCVQKFGDGLDVGGVIRSSLWLVRSECIGARLDIGGNTRQRVREDLVLELETVWRLLLDLDEIVLDHHFAHGLVRLQMTDTVTRLVSGVVLGLECTEQVARMNDEGGSTDLTEAERRHDTSTDAIGLYRFGWEDKEGAMHEVIVDVAVCALV